MTILHTHAIIKRAVAALLCVLILLCLSGCSVNGSRSIVGTWTCDDINDVAAAAFGLTGDIAGMDFLGSLAEGIDIDVSLTFRENGTYQLDMAVNLFFLGTDTQSTSGTYTWENDTLTIDGSVVDAKLSGKTLTISEKTSDGLNVRLNFNKQD